MRKWIIWMLCWPALAQDVSIDISPRIIGINETVSFSIVIEGDHKGRMPTFVDGFKTGAFQLAQRTPSRSTNMSMINGVVSSEMTFTYRLSPTQKGTFVLPPQKVQFDGKIYTSEAVEIEVGEPVERRRRRSSIFDIPNYNNRRSTSLRKDGLIAAIETNKKSYYLGEPITLDVAIYLDPNFSIDWSQSSLKMPELSDFWVENIPFAGKPNRELRNQRRYNVFRISKQLYANRSGTIHIPLATLQLAVNNGPSASLFSSPSLYDISTNELDLEILELPTQGQPKGFSGLVGNFRLQMDVENPQIKLGETVSLKLMLLGSGSFRSINELSLDHLERDFEIFSGGIPTTAEKDGLTTAKTWTFALVPRKEGQFQLTAPDLSYFNLNTKSYAKLEANPITIQVDPGQGLGDGVRVTANESSEQTLDLPQNLQYIKRDPLQQGERKRANRPDLLAQVLVGFLLLDILVYMALFIREKSGQHRAGQRPAHAFKNFQRTVAKLKVNDDNPDAYYAALSQAIFNYFGDKWDRAGQGVSLDLIADRFHRANIDEGLLQKLTEVVEACDLARFTPSTPESRDHLTQRAKAVIKDVEGALS